MKKIVCATALAAIFCILILTAGCADGMPKPLPGQSLPPKLHVEDSNTATGEGQVDGNGTEKQGYVKAELVSAGGDFASWNAFAPGKGINTSIANDFGWKLTIRLPQDATITGITISNRGTRQAWSTKAGAYPLVLVGPNKNSETVQLAGTSDVKIGPYNAGTYKFMAYGQPEAASYGQAITPFNGGEVAVELLDGTVLRGIAGASSMLPQPPKEENEPADYKIFQERDSLRGKFPPTADIDETIVVASISPAEDGGSGFILISRKGGKPEKIPEGGSFEVKRRAYSDPYIVKVGVVGRDSSGNLGVVLYLYKSGTTPA